MCNLTGNVRSWHTTQESFLPMRRVQITQLWERFSQGLHLWRRAIEHYFAEHFTNCLVIVFVWKTLISVPYFHFSFVGDRAIIETHWRGLGLIQTNIEGTNGKFYESNLVLKCRSKRLCNLVRKTFDIEDIYRLAGSFRKFCDLHVYTLS